MDKRKHPEDKILQLATAGKRVDPDMQERALNEARANFFGEATPDEEVDLSNAPTDEQVAQAQLEQMQNAAHEHNFIPVGIMPVGIPPSKVAGVDSGPSVIPCIIYACDGCPGQSISPINQQMINDLTQAVVMARASQGSGIVVPGQ